MNIDDWIKERLEALGHHSPDEWCSDGKAILDSGGNPIGAMEFGNDLEFVIEARKHYRTALMALKTARGNLEISEIHRAAVRSEMKKTIRKYNTERCTYCKEEHDRRVACRGYRHHR